MVVFAHIGDKEMVVFAHIGDITLLLFLIFFAHRWWDGAILTTRPKDHRE
jgi:hypothetical protein